MSEELDTDMEHFSVTTEQIDLPSTATPQARRVAVAWRGRPICAFTQGLHRCYLYPLYSPAGVPLTAESPVDHPHHDSVTVGADMVIAKFPPLTPAISPLTESGTYNLYANNVFQGRSPGRTWSVDVNATELAPDHLRVVQTVEWQGPEEWGAADGRRVLAVETRITDIRPGDVVNTVDIRSQLRPTEWDLTLGPTRHAYFTVRLAYGLRVVDGGTLIDAEGRRGGAAITNQASAWVDASGAAPHGSRAGLTVLGHASTAHVPWVAYDWGTVNVNPFAREAATVQRGDMLDLGIRLLAHEGDAGEVDIAAHAAELAVETAAGASISRAASRP
ncbi:MAG: PmoA family protein [Chloroflexi bacterium]|nr:PmoA family protein [Chloroflexota bacterium]